ncbi:MAG: hypothetical protein AB3N28_09770 [Kordiimonas sp.]
MLRLCVYLFFCVASFPVLAVDFYIQKPYDQPNADYEVKLLRIALDHMPGQHTITFVPISYSQGRAFRELARGTAPINILYSGYSKEREAITRMVYVPLTRGLLGNRMFIIHEKDDALFKNITHLEQLTNRITVGVGTTRPEEIILPSAGFSIVRSPGNQLIPMFLRGRFTSLLYGLDEIDLVYSDITNQQTNRSTIINKDILLSYKFDSFFFVQPGDDIRANLVEEGLKRAYASGAFMEHFRNFPPIQVGLSLFDTHKPKVFKIVNPDLSTAVKNIPANYWHDFDTTYD